MPFLGAAVWRASILKAQKNNGMQSQKAIIGTMVSRLIARLLVPTEQYKNKSKKEYIYLNTKGFPDAANDILEIK